MRSRRSYQSKVAQWNLILLLFVFHLLLINNVEAFTLKVVDETETQ